MKMYLTGPLTYDLKKACTFFLYYKTFVHQKKYWFI